MKPKTSVPSPTTHSAAPVRSRRTRASRRPSRGTKPSTITSVASATGTLRRKITRQLQTPISQPPSSGPNTVDVPLHAVQVPIAVPRSTPENVVVIIASEAGVRSAPATPWRPRKTISAVGPGAAAQSADAAPKQATPSVNTRTSP